ncbi:aminodeoxychorismate synthase component I [Pseudonocardia kujensis]|uniref:aminodeoxychorismate synthase component I n=1 Tax=Pseudonocardia kujensis TaxID=1128675 RepID=UPI001E2E115F|nr:aminodeoxychorismate synthase component I [Pseudonocardia kujensis]MCE0768470.1 aminodeoxychorismate synthase component I [Pseudonocardia kujensis]
MSGPWARVDDLVAGAARLFPRAEAELVARRPAEVAEVLDEVERRTDAGWWAFGMVTYEAAAGLDPTLVTREPVDGLPLAWFGLTREAQAVPVVAHGARSPYAAGPWVAEWDAAAHRAAVGTVRERIAAGETYQCNLTTRLTATVSGDLTQLYRDLALGQRGAYHAYLDTGRFVVASASPELFLETRGDRILVRPMKGTAPRGRTTEEDDEAVARLRGSAKERAENIMIVDLMRNDLARLARPGTVTVPRLLGTERYPTVHQLTSDVTARLRPGVGLTETFRALFPCGSVTGAPKARTMRLIREVEASPRGVYCGAIGVVAPAGHPVRARFSVAIRTVVVDRERGTATYGTGGGVTWDSEPAAEYAELRAKARVLDARPEDFHLIETMRHEAGRLHSLDAHLARVCDSAAYFGFRFDEDAVRRGLTERLAGRADARVRLRCYRDGAVGVDVEDLPSPAAGPVRLVVDPEPIDATQCWPHHKTSRREPYSARLARHPAADDVLLLNGHGEVTESCTANLAVRLDGVWWTPPLGSGCLPGVERGLLAAAGRLRERTLRPGDLLRAEDLALVSSLRGWRRAALTSAPAPSARSS